MIIIVVSILVVGKVEVQGKYIVRKRRFCFYILFIIFYMYCRLDEMYLFFIYVYIQSIVYFRGYFFGWKEGEKKKSLVFFFYKIVYIKVFFLVWF